MSNFSRPTLHPISKKYLNAAWLDNHFGSHNYGVKFGNDNTYYSKDFNRQNNNLNNLEWVTPKENTAHAIAAGRCDRGEKHYKAKFTRFAIQRMRLIRQISPSISSVLVAKMFGTSAGNIRDIWERRTWKHI